MANTNFKVKTGLEVGTGVTISAGIITAVSFSGNATNATYAVTAGVSTYSGVSGFSTFSGYSNTSGFSTFSNYANNAGIATYAWTAGVSTYSGVAGYSTFSGYSDTTGFSTFSGYANASGVSTSVIGGIASVTQLQVSGISTLGSGTTVIGSFFTNQLSVSGVSTASTVNDTSGNVRIVPQNSQTTAYILVASDSGKHIDITTGGVTVPASVFSVGDVVTIFNDSTSNQIITQGGSVTLRQAGTANTGNRTLAQYGLATILCVAPNTFVISGAGLS